MKEIKYKTLSLRNAPMTVLLFTIFLLTALLPAIFLIARNLSISKNMIGDVYTSGLVAGLDTVNAEIPLDENEALTELDLCTSYWQRNYQYTVFLLNGSQELLYTSSYNLKGNHPFPLPTKPLSQFAGISGPKALLYQDLYRGQFILVGSPLGANHQMLAVFPIPQFETSLRPIYVSALLFFIMVIMLAALGCVLIYRLICAPIKSLLYCMRNQGKPSQLEYYIGWNSEIGKLCFSYYSRETSYASSLEEISKMNQQKRESELEVLQNQINSHFIYNTLNNIQWLAQAGRTQDVIDTVQALDLLLRGLAHNQDDLVTLEQELTYCEAYLIAQKIRFDKLFSFAFDVDPLLLQMKVPKFILQPLVENSIYHGFLDGGQDSGIIEVTIRRRGHRIDITVHDDGIGIEKQRIQDVLKNEHKSSSRYMGVAIGNINRRIKLLCGREYGIGINSAFGEYTEVQITVPLTL